MECCSINARVSSTTTKGEDTDAEVRAPNTCATRVGGQRSQG